MPASFAQQLSAAAHVELTVANPLAHDAVDRLLDLIAARSPHTAVDVGCGFGPFAIGLAARTGVDVLAVDDSDLMLDRGRVDASARSLRGTVRFVATDASTIEGQFDVVMCVGSSHVFGTTSEALRACASLAAPEGAVLFADLEWTVPPTAEFLAFLGVDAGVYWSADEARARFIDAGMVAVHEETASPDDWDAYERAIAAGRARFADSIGGEAADQVRARSDAWAEAYETWAKHCLRFTAYLATR